MLLSAPQSPLDALWEAGAGLTLKGQHVARWHSQKGHAFLDQPEVCARPRLIANGPNGNPFLRFNGVLDHMLFRAFGADKGPHTFLMVIRPERGLILDSQHGGPVVVLPASGWQLIEIVQDSAMPINGETALGSDYYGRRGFFKGDLALFGYKQGLLGHKHRASLHKQYREKYGLAEEPLGFRRLFWRLWWEKAA